MKNLTSLLFCLALTSCLFAQNTNEANLNLSIDPISYSRFSTEDALSLTVVSSAQKPLNAFFEISISYESGFKVVAAKSQTVTLNTGVNRFTKNNVKLLTKKYQNNDFGKYEQNNGFLPNGSYNICVALKCADQECLISSKLFELDNRQIVECTETFSVNPTPLLLASPFDEAELTEKRPNFSWIPPMPLGTDPNLTYRFTLVELKEKQRGEAGIRRNRPIYRVEGLQTINLPFPAELEDLKVSTKYAWQVEAVLGKTPVQTSEVWEFEIVEEEEKIFPMPYVRLKLSDDQIYKTLNEVKFIYQHDGKSEDLEYQLYSITGESLDIVLPKQTVKHGENMYKIDLREYGLKSAGYYKLRVESKNGTFYELDFKYFFRKDVK